MAAKQVIGPDSYTEVRPGIWTNDNGVSTQEYNFTNGTMVPAGGMTGTSEGGYSATGGADLSASDFATRTGLPQWGNDFISKIASDYTAPTWEMYQNSINALAQNPANTEAARKASEENFVNATQAGLAEAGRDAAITLAANGTTNSSVGTDYVGELASNAIAAAQAQHQVNVGAASADYGNLVDTAQATQDMSAMIGGYLGNTKESYSPNYPGDLNPGTDEYGNPMGQLTNPDGTGDWNPVSGLDTNATYGEKYTLGGIGLGTGGAVRWSPPPEWTPMGGTTFSYGGQTFDYDTETGQISNVAGVTGDTAPYIDAADLAGRSGLEPYAAAQVKSVVDQYGEPAMANAFEATAQVNAAGYQGGKIDQETTQLNQQYGTLSETTLQMLSTALGSSGLTGASSGGLMQSSQDENLAAVNRAEASGNLTAANTGTMWNAGTKNQNLQDSVKTSQGLAGIIGDYLGLAKYSYDPNIEAYLSYNAGQPLG